MDLRCNGKVRRIRNLGVHKNTTHLSNKAINELRAHGNTYQGSQMPIIPISKPRFFGGIVPHFLRHLVAHVKPGLNVLN
jgi:hypothetical protein